MVRCCPWHRKVQYTGSESTGHPWRCSCPLSVWCQVAPHLLRAPWPRWQGLCLRAVCVGGLLPAGQLKPEEVSGLAKVALVHAMSWAGKTAGLSPGPPEVLPGWLARPMVAQLCEEVLVRTPGGSKSPKLSNSTLCGFCPWRALMQPQPGTKCRVLPRLGAPCPSGSDLWEPNHITQGPLSPSFLRFSSVEPLFLCPI